METQPSGSKTGIGPCNCISLVSSTVKLHWTESGKGVKCISRMLYALLAAIKLWLTQILAKNEHARYMHCWVVCVQVGVRSEGCLCSEVLSLTWSIHKGNSLFPASDVKQTWTEIAEQFHCKRSKVCSFLNGKRCLLQSSSPFHDSRQFLGMTVIAIQQGLLLIVL